MILSLSRSADTKGGDDPISFHCRPRIRHHCAGEFRYVGGILFLFWPQYLGAIIHGRLSVPPYSCWP